MKRMKMSEELEDQYSRIFLKYTSNMARLDDKDKDLNAAERKVEFHKILKTMETKIKGILDDKQYELHLSNLNGILRSVYRRANLEWDRE